MFSSRHFGLSFGLIFPAGFRQLSAVQVFAARFKSFIDFLWRYQGEFFSTFTSWHYIFI